MFLGALLLSFVALFVRCVYRIPEPSGGWTNSVMQSETDFIVLDGVYVVSSSIFILLLQGELTYSTQNGHARRSSTHSPPPRLLPPR